MKSVIMSSDESDLYTKDSYMGKWKNKNDATFSKFLVIGEHEGGGGRRRTQLILLNSELRI